MSNINEKVKDFMGRVEGVTTILGSYIESNLKDKEKLDRTLKSFIQSVESLVRDGIQSTAINKKVRLKVKTLEHFKGDLPKYESSGASGIDVRAQLDETIILQPGERALVPTALSFEIPEGYEIQARPRSGLAIKKGISLVNSPGTIDADYRGEVKIIIINHGEQAFEIQDQDRVAQLVVAPVIQAELEMSADLSETDRGEGGFGSTGVGEKDDSSETP